MFVSLFTRTCSGVISPSPLSRFPFPPRLPLNTLPTSRPLSLLSSALSSPHLGGVSAAADTHGSDRRESGAETRLLVPVENFYPPTQNAEPRSLATTILPPGSATALRPRGCGAGKSCPAGAISLRVREQDSSFFFSLSLPLTELRERS